LPENLRSAIVSITSPADLDFALRLAAKNLALDLLLPRDRETALGHRPSGVTTQAVQDLFAKANVLEGFGTGPITPTDVRHSVALARGLAMLRAQAFATDTQVIGAETMDISRPHEPDAVRWVSALFGDFKGFSKLDDDSVARFTSVVLGLIAQSLEPYQAEVLMLNTWGDGIFIVIGDTATAAAASMHLCHAVKNLDLQAHRLPPSLGLRLGIHHTCATIATDPLTKKKTVIGRGISTAARIEPITPEGAVYVTESFAAALATHPNGEGFTCDYVGLIPLAKDFGAMRMFQLGGKRNCP
jgi:class 3 adenylate cyclase